MVDAIKNSVNRLDLTKARSSETRTALGRCEPDSCTRRF